MTTAGSSGRPRDGQARAESVHSVQYELETFNMWHAQRAFGTLRATELEALQLVLPASWVCRHDRHPQPHLSDPDARLHGRAA